MYICSVMYSLRKSIIYVPCSCIGVFMYVCMYICTYVHTYFSTQAAEVCGSLEIDSAIDVVQGLSKSMDMYRREAGEGKLLLLPGETVSAK